jgi:hypothetical protein
MGGKSVTLRRAGYARLGIDRVWWAEQREVVSWRVMEQRLAGGGSRVRFRAGLVS